MDRRKTKTKDSIKFSLLKLIKTKPLDKITVTELALEANIERKTFYLHYSCIDDIIKELEDSVYTFIMSKLGKYIGDDNYDIHDIFTEIDKLLVYYMPYLKELSKSEHTVMLLNSFVKNIIRNYIREFLINNYNVNKTLVNYYVEFYSSGLATVYMSFINDKTISIDDLTNIAYQMCFSGADNILATKRKK